MKAERGESLIWLLRLWDWRRSGLSLAAYCRWSGLSYPTALAWQRRCVRTLLGPLPGFEVRR